MYENTVLGGKKYFCLESLSKKKKLKKCYLDLLRGHVCLWSQFYYLAVFVWPIIVLI